MVAIDRVAVVLVLDLRSLDSLQVSWYPRCPWLETPDHHLLCRWVCVTHMSAFFADSHRLPASPLWLIGLYTPAFAPMNAVFPPPVWFSVCFCIMEICSIGFPIMDVLKGNKLRQETLDAIANWEARQKSNGLDAASVNAASKSSSEYSTTTTLKSGGDVSIGNQSFDSQKSDILTMTALENALRTNAMPLLQFAALKDFSGKSCACTQRWRILTAFNRRKRQLPHPRRRLASLLVLAQVIHRRTPPQAVPRRYAHLRSLYFPRVFRISYQHFFQGDETPPRRFREDGQPPIWPSPKLGVVFHERRHTFR
jgi:hypothetical protein